MRKAIAITLVALASFLVVAAAASADVNDPGSGCNDQPNGPSCVPDPSDNGQDCEAHGANGDGNENHCLTTTTPATTTTATSTTATTSTQTVTTTSATTTTPTEPPSTTTETPLTSSTTTTTVSPSPTSEAPGPSGPSGPIHNGTSGPEKPQESKLAFTGVEDVVPIVGAAVALLTGGMAMLWFGCKDD